MVIYMSMPGIPGSTTAQGYNKWIPLSSLDCGVGRIIETAPGRVVDRIRSNALGTEMEITKSVDQTSPLLFIQACGGEAVPKVQIDVCYATTDGLIAYLQYILSNVLVSEYYASLDADGGNFEFVALNYTDIEISFIPQNALNEGSPTRAQAQVGCRPSQSTHIRRQIQARTSEGFNLFVATVYGEMVGVKHAPTLVWQAVGSVIMNRVNTGIWHRYKTTDAIIAHTGFDAYTNPNRINWDNVNFNSHSVRNHQQFLKAWAALHHIPINHRNALVANEFDILTAIRTQLEDIYYKSKVITPANYYYSPRAMLGKLPSFLNHVDNPKQYQVFIPGIDENEIKLYYIPTKIERKAGRKK